MVTDNLEADNVDVCGRAVRLRALYLIRLFNAALACVFIVVQIRCIFANF